MTMADVVVDDSGAMDRLIQIEDRRSFDFPPRQPRQDRDRERSLLLARGQTLPAVRFIYQGFACVGHHHDKEGGSKRPGRIAQSAEETVEAWDGRSLKMEQRSGQ